ncbi:hypothetical protein [Mesorhizobium sp.]|nr:hypothetical protein [Mesorhizobium sp.]
MPALAALEVGIHLTADKVGLVAGVDKSRNRHTLFKAGEVP